MAKTFLRYPRQEFKHSSYTEFKSFFSFADPETSLYLCLGFGLLEILSKFKYSPNYLKSINNKLLELHEETKVFCTSNHINLHYIEEYMKHYKEIDLEKIVPKCFNYINTLAMNDNTTAALDYAIRNYICTICKGKNELLDKILNYKYLTKEECNAIMTNFTNKFSVNIYIYDGPQPEVYTSNAKNEVPCLHLFRGMQTGQLYNHDKNKYEDIEIVMFSMVYTADMEDIEKNQNFPKTKVQNYPFLNKIFKAGPVIRGEKNDLSKSQIIPLRDRSGNASPNTTVLSACPNVNPKVEYQVNVRKIPEPAGSNAPSNFPSNTGYQQNLAQFNNPNIFNANPEYQQNKPQILNSNPSANFGHIENTKATQSIPTDILEILDSWAGLLIKHQISDNNSASQAKKIITSYPNMPMPDNIKNLSSTNFPQISLPNRVVDFIDLLAQELNQYKISSKNIINHTNQISSEFQVISNLNSIKFLRNSKPLKPQIAKILESNLPQQDIYYCSYGCNTASGIACMCQNQELFICNDHIQHHFQTGNHNHSYIFKTIQPTEVNEWKNYYNSIRNSALNITNTADKSLEKIHNFLIGNKNSIVQKIEGFRVLIENKLKNLEEQNMIKEKDDSFFSIAECLGHINEKDFTQHFVQEILEFVKN